MKEKFDKLITFINNNRLLSFLVFLALILIMPLLFRTNDTATNVATNTPSVAPTLVGDYTTLVSDPSFEYFEFKGKYYVVVKDDTTQDKEKIRAYLKIPADRDFEVVLSKILEPTSRASIYEQELNK